jgi:hypothetical protein
MAMDALEDGRYYCPSKETKHTQKHKKKNTLTMYQVLLCWFLVLRFLPSEVKVHSFVMHIAAALSLFCPCVRLSLSLSNCAWAFVF